MFGDVFEENTMFLYSLFLMVFRSSLIHLNSLDSSSFHNHSNMQLSATLIKIKTVIIKNSYRT